MKHLTRVSMIALPAAVAIAMPREVMALTTWANQVGSDYTFEVVVAVALIGVAVFLDTILWPLLTRE